MVSGLPPDELIELFQTARQAIWRYQLDKIEVSALKTAMRSTEKAAEQILARSSERLKRWEQLRRQDLIREIDSLTLGIREQVSGEISNLAGQAGAESVKYHSQTMSLGGRVQGFNNVALSPEQFRSFFQTTPLGGATLNQWVNRAFDATVRQGILEDLGAGVLQGNGYPWLVDNIMGHMEGFTRKEAVTLARTYVQQANVTANDAVMAANRDIIKKWKWSAVLENSNIQTGTGTCIRCSVLDGQEFEFGEGPPMILHPRCRCVRLPVLVSYRELGLDIDELEEVARPWTERPDIPIGEGGRNITGYGTHKGEYATWFESRGAKFQKNVVGPKRYELIQAGKVKFKDLVDPQTGRLYRLDELVGGGAKGGGFMPAKSIKDATIWAKRQGVYIDPGEWTLSQTNSVNKAIYDAKQAGDAIPNSIRIGLDDYGPGNVLGFNDAVQGLAEWEKDGKVVKRVWLRDQFDGSGMKGYVLDNTFEGTVRHEIAHISHVERFKKAVGDDDVKWMNHAFSKVNVPSRVFTYDVIKEVSPYALTNNAEFVAEVRSGMLAGRKFSETVMNIFDAATGVELGVPKWR